MDNYKRTRLTKIFGLCFRQRKLRLFSLLLTFMAFHPSMLQAASVIDTLAPGEWYQVPNSNIRAVVPNPAPPGTTGPASVIIAWSGGAYDTKRDRWIIWGGGHSDYSGNELYVFDVNTLLWQRITNPSTDVTGIESSGYYSDGKPRSRHTYDYIQYVPGIDRFCAFGGTGLYPSGQIGVPNVDCFNFDNLTWERKADTPSPGIGAISAYDSSTGLIWVHGSGILSSWNPSTNVWTQRSDPDNVMQSFYYLTAAIDPVRHKLFAVGGGMVASWDLNSSGKLTRASPATTGDATAVSAQNPGFVYVASLDKFVAWSGGANIFTLDPVTLIWTRISPASINTVIPTTPPSQGTFARFQYVPSKNVLLVVNSIDENVYIYKLPSGTGGDTLPPSAPTGLTVTAVSSSQINLSWNASSDNIGVTGYKIFRNGTQISAVSGTSYQDTGLSPSTAYSYTLAAYDAAGNASAQSASASATTQAVAPSPPTVLLSASPNTVTSGGVSTLTWSSTNTTSCSASGGWSGTKGLSGSASTDSLLVNTTYTLTCSGTAGSASQSVIVTISNSSPPPLGGIVASFALTSTSTGTKPFSIGHAFRQGDVPSGQTVTSTDTMDFQATIKNTWSDGSAKFAILSGRVALTANTPKTINLILTNPTGGTVLSEADLMSTGVAGSIQFGSTCSVDLSSLIGVTSTFNGGRWTAGRVRTWISGPAMSNWIYYSPCGADPHLSVWFDVRLYSGGEVEILPWIENATLNVASPGVKGPATATFTLGGIQRYSGTLTLPHHTRAVLASGTTYSHWLGTNPAVTPMHDVAYLQATKMVPTYRARVSSGSTLWNRVAQSYTPLTSTQIPYSNMGGTGYAIWIGLLPEWNVAHLTSNSDARAYNGSIVNDYSAGGLGIHYRDETTNQPPRFSSYPNLVMNGAGSNINNTGASSTNSYTPAASGASPGNWDTPHHPTLGYFTYLLTGRFYFLEELQFVASVNFLIVTDTKRQFAQGVLPTDTGSLIPRGAAWSLRTLAQAAAVTPDGETLAAEYLNSYGSNINYYHTKYVAQSNNPQGFVKSYDDYNGVGTNPWVFAPWMDDFFTASVGWGLDIVTGLSATNQTKLSQFFVWKANAVIGRLGGSSASEYYFADAAQYNLPLAPQDNANFENGTGPWYPSFGAIYDAQFGAPHPNTPVDNNLRGGNFPDGTSYWGNLQPAIAYAVHHNVAGAQAAYNRMIGAANWSSLASTWNDNPIWSVMPSGSIGTSPPSITAPPNAPTNLTLH